MRGASFALALFALSLDPAPPAGDEVGPMILVAAGATPREAAERLGAAEADALADDERAAAIAIAALPEADLERLSSALEILAARLEVRRNPLVEDLEDGEPEGALEAVVTARSSVFAAANALSSRRVASADGLTVVALASSCEGARARCFPAWRRSDSAEDRRARFFAWPVSLAAVLAFDDDASLAGARERLRRASAADGSTVALALDGDELAGRRRGDARGVALREKARQVLALAGGGDDLPPLLRALARDAAPGRPLLPWLALAPRTLYVVPRLGALSNLARFTAEVAAATGDAKPRWIHRPI